MVSNIRGRIMARATGVEFLRKPAPGYGKVAAFRAFYRSRKPAFWGEASDVFVGVTFGSAAISDTDWLFASAAAVSWATLQALRRIACQAMCSAMNVEMK